MPFKNLRLTLVLLSHFTKLVFVFGSGKLSEIGIVVQKGHAALDYDHTFKVKVEFISGKKFNQMFTVIKQVGCESSLKM